MLTFLPEWIKLIILAGTTIGGGFLMMSLVSWQENYAIKQHNKSIKMHRK